MQRQPALRRGREYGFGSGACDRRAAGIGWQLGEKVLESGRISPESAAGEKQVWCPKDVPQGLKPYSFEGLYRPG